MTSGELHPRAAEYLERLGDAAEVLPKADRRELLAEIEAHLREVAGSDVAEVEVLRALDRLGEPGEIVDAHIANFGSTSPGPQPGGSRLRDYVAIALLLFGGFFVGIGWLIGVILLWSSRTWNVRDKWAGTLLIPGGLATVAALGLRAASVTTQSCSGFGGPVRCQSFSSGGGTAFEQILVLLAGVACIASAVYLAYRASRA